jgi:hypothetical protein
MAFKVKFNHRSDSVTFGDSDDYLAREGGVLEIRKFDGTVQLFSPQAWLMVEAKDHRSGSVAFG